MLTEFDVRYQLALWYTFLAIIVVVGYLVSRRKIKKNTKRLDVIEPKVDTLEEIIKALVGENNKDS